MTRLSKWRNNWLVCFVFGLAASLTLTAPTTAGTVQLVNPLLDPLITFDEVTPLTIDPSITAGGTTVHFGSLFDGQVLGTNPNSLSDSSPNDPLRLAAVRPSVSTRVDLSNQSIMVLGGAGSSTGFTTPLAMQFEDPVFGVAFSLGHLDAAGSATIQVYDERGGILGSFTNSQGGTERFEFSDIGNRNVIAGVSVFVQANQMDWEGFALDDVNFHFIPEPSALMLSSVLCLLTAPLVRKRRRTC